MHIRRYILFILGMLAITQSVFAMDAARISDTLSLTLINRSTETFHYIGANKTNPSNSFSVTSSDIPPGGSTVITGITTPYFDLSGELQFKDNEGKNHLLTIIDFRQIHIGQSVFSMMDNHFISFVKSKRFNTDQGPRSLTYDLVEVEIQDKF